MTREEAYEELNISTILIPKGYANRPQGVNTKEFITIHETDNYSVSADADNHALYMKGPDARKRKVSWHFTVDDDEVIKHIPTGETCWHSGSKEGNRTSVGIEMCVNGGTLSMETRKRTALLVAILMQAEGIPIENVVQHNHWSQKDCPQLLRKARGWKGFLALVKGYADSLAEG